MRIHHGVFRISGNLMRPNREIKRIARAHLNGHYMTVVPSQLIVSLLPSLILLPFSLLLPNTRSITQSLLYLLAYLIVMLLSVVLSAGYQFMHLNIARKKPYSFKDLIRGFQVRPDSYIVTALLLFLISLPFLLAMAASLAIPIVLRMTYENPYVLIPGILIYIAVLVIWIAFLLRYALFLPILADDPNQRARDVLKKSRRMMTGHRKQLFLLLLSFIGWYLLGLLSMAVGFLWIYPYVWQSITVFYQELSGELLPVQEVPSPGQSSLAQP